jgi:hypothetical protein
MTIEGPFNEDFPDTSWVTDDWLLRKLCEYFDDTEDFKAKLMGLPIFSNEVREKYK